MNPVDRSSGVDGVFATQRAPVAASVNVMSVKVPPTSMASVQGLVTGPVIVDLAVRGEKGPVPGQAAGRLLHFDQVDGEAARTVLGRRRFVV
jgi:hypothetical protein